MDGHLGLSTVASPCTLGERDLGLAAWALTAARLPAAFSRPSTSTRAKGKLPIASKTLTLLILSKSLITGATWRFFIQRLIPTPRPLRSDPYAGSILRTEW